MSVCNFHTSTFPQAIESPETTPTLSIIVPFFNEQEVLETFHQRLTVVLDSLSESCEIVYVDDGSDDNSLNIARNFVESTTHIRCITLSRNFGKESAMSAGLEHSYGEAIIVIDADLQDPPELIPEMLAKWREGYDVVNMQRRERRGETWFKRFSAACYYKLLNNITKLEVPENVGDFRLLSRKVVKHINELPERNRYMKGIFSWPGFRQTTIQFDRDERFCGETKWNYIKLIALAMDGITSFSIRPLRIATLSGIIVAASAFIYGSFILFKTLVHGDPVSGYPSIMLMMLGLGGVQLLSVGLLGEYVGRVFVETKQRPLYLIDTIFEHPKKGGSAKKVKNKVVQAG